MILFLCGLVLTARPQRNASPGAPQRMAVNPKNRLRNRLYTVTPLKDGSILLRNQDGSQQTFTPRFTILYRAADPGLKEYLDPSVNFIVPAWTKSGTPKGQTVSLYESGESITVTASSSLIRSQTLSWSFPVNAIFELTASLTLPPGSTLPLIRYSFIPKEAGWYSIGYTGSPAIEPAGLKGLWQPLIWQERRFPTNTYLSMEHMCPLPAAILEEKTASQSIVVDPSEIPFRMPTFRNARFGVLLRNNNGLAQVQTFAPVMGGEGSKMEAGQPFHFSFRLLTQKGSWLDIYQYLARSVFHFHDYRQNATASLNETLDNMIDFAMNDSYSGWNPDLKGFDYSTDVKGTVKLVSALHPLSLALIRDNPEIYHRRALPMIEYILSREKYLFTLNEGEHTQNPSHFLKGPAVEVSELAALYSISRGRSPVFRHYADSLFEQPRMLNLSILKPARSWQEALALYRMTRNPTLLDSAVKGAIRYIQNRIERPPGDFSDAHVGIPDGGQFWTDFSPKWFDLLELYETTRDRRFLEAAHYGARIYASYVWMQPVVPDSEVWINPKGVLPMGDPWSKKDPQPISAPPLRVPAWRVAQVGLTPEASNTYNVNPAVFMTTYAAYMLRLAHYTGDTFLKDIARSAVVGRYTNYPGYDINLEYTTFYQRPDYPLHALNELTYNQIYYNHVWPHIALLTDYLLTDALYKSHGKIDFPSRYAEGYAYLHTKVYGDQPGVFYGDSVVFLWMPQGLLRTDNIQINYVAARGNGNFYLALLNQSANPQTVRVNFNPDMIPIDGQKGYPVKIWKEVPPAGSLPVTTSAILDRGALSLTIAGNGITAIRIKDIPIRPRFQQEVFDSLTPSLPRESYGEWQTPFGKVSGMMISMGHSLTSAYVWLQATEKEVQSAVIHYRQGRSGIQHTMTDNSYPFEFSVPLSDTKGEWEFWIDGKDPSGKEIHSETMVLKK